MEFSLDLQNGLLKPAIYKLSPNCDERPKGTLIDLLVIHGISLPPGQFLNEAVVSFFSNQLDFSADPFYEKIKDLKVSAHLFIRRTGEVIQCVPFHQRAWHAGVSYHAGREKCNDFSIGIELEGTDIIPYDDRQYRQLAKITKVLMETYPAITLEHIVGHSDIAPDRKTDPGPAFDWGYYKRLLLEG